ncbi:type II and III secretion system protein family protein [Hyphococcus flavus]|uniref:Type II and III secretion system protein family protein n=1 Tax=Hyphococcus flavus TaxID=1866326 RepID=A0AAE9ZLX6_9PROT|nr:type II and III secretion system protein family protein [Hyphococcus flavus]WDI33195.1 type II and III secretion system protein family protein [Hyphococcus flavus]
MPILSKALKSTGMLVGAIAGTISLSISGDAMAQRGAYPVSIDMGGESAVSKSIILPLNKAAIVELPRGAADVLVSQPSVVDAVVRSPRRVYLLGLTTGQTNAFFFDNQGRQILNLEIQVERDVDALKELFGRVMPDARIEVEVVSDNIILRGTAQSASEAANATELAARFVGNPENVINMVAIRDPEQVMLKVRIVEMQRQLLKQLGVSTTGTVQLSDAAFSFAAANSIATNGGIGLSGTKVNTGDLQRIDASLQAFESNGLIRVLAEPNLTAVSGESARFLAGGEFPVPVGQDDGVISIEFKEFGVGLGFTPLVLSKGRINVKISTEVSEITTENAFFVPGATTVDEDGNLITTAGLSIPGLSVRRANTVVELPSGGSLVMAGLLQEDMRSTIEGVPGVKDLPVLGQLFRSRNYTNNETELVIIVTPYLVNPTHESNLLDPTKGFVPASDAETILFGKIVNTYGLAGAGVNEASLQGPMGFILD